MAATTSTDDLFEVIPSPGEIRKRLGRMVREADILRRQLKVSEAAAKVAHVDLEATTDA